MSPREQHRTAFTMKALDLASIYQYSLGELRLSGRRIFRSELSSPEGPSTGGGVQAVQHLMLVPLEEAGTFAGTFVAAHANQADMTAQLRTYDQVAFQYRDRFKSAVPFARGEYEDFMLKVQAFLQSQDFTVMIEPFIPPSPAVAQETASSGGGRMLFLAIVLALVAAGVVIATNM